MLYAPSITVKNQVVKMPSINLVRLLQEPQQIHVFPSQCFTRTLICRVGRDRNSEEDNNDSQDKMRKTFGTTFHVLTKSRKYGDPARIRTVFTDSKVSTAAGTTFRNFKNFASPMNVKDPFFLNFTLPERKKPFTAAESNMFANGIGGSGGYINVHDNYDQVEIPTEDEIKAEYEFKLPIIVSKQENPKVVGHFLEVMNGPMKLTEDLIIMAQKMIAKYQGMKNELLDQINGMKGRHEGEIAALQEKYLPLILAYIRKMKEDFINQQNDNFKLQKEIAMYRREIANYETRIETEKKRMHDLEVQIFGMEVYELQTDVQYLEDIPYYNLREECSKHTNIKPVIH